MKFFPGSRLRAGIEICPGNIKSALVEKKGEGVFVRAVSQVNFPEEILKPSFKMENILDGKAFHSCLKQSCEKIEFKKTGIGLPNASIKVIIKEFNDLPKGSRAIHELIVWTVSRSLHLSQDEIRVSWKNMGKNQGDKQVFLIALGMEEILVQYEEAFRQAGITPVMLAPGGVQQFDFYSKIFPQTGRAAYLGMFDDFVNLFVFDNGIPIFYSLSKKGVLSQKNVSAKDASAIDNIDFLIQYFYTENPDFKIDRFFIASPIKSEAQIKQIFQDLGEIEFTLMDERQLIAFDIPSEEMIHPEELPLYSGAFGAAMGA